MAPQTPNEFGVRSDGGLIRADRISRLVARPITEDEALNLAAWLITTVGNARYERTQRCATHGYGCGMQEKTCSLAVAR